MFTLTIANDYPSYTLCLLLLAVVLSVVGTNLKKAAFTIFTKNTSVEVSF